MMMMPFAEICWRSDGVRPPGGLFERAKHKPTSRVGPSCDARVVGLEKMVDCKGIYIIYICQ